MAQRTLIVERPAKSTKATSKKPSANGSQDRERVLEAFRRWGYLQADVDPLGLLKPLKYSDMPTQADTYLNGRNAGIMPMGSAPAMAGGSPVNPTSGINKYLKRLLVQIRNSFALAGQ